MFHIVITTKHNIQKNIKRKLFFIEIPIVKKKNLRTADVSYAGPAACGREREGSENGAFESRLDAILFGIFKQP